MARSAHDRLWNLHLLNAGPWNRVNPGKSRMKDNKTSTTPSPLTADSQNRLLAYSTAAGLGAFFAGQPAEAAVVQAPGLASYPHVFVPVGPVGSANESHFYLSIEGGSKTNFDLLIAADLLSHPTNQFGSQVIDLIGIAPDTNNPAILNGQALAALMPNGTTNAYCGPFLGGAIIGTNAYTTVPSYHPRLGLSYNYGPYPWSNPAWTEVPGFPVDTLGFEFTSSVDGQNHFGYMNVAITFASASLPYIDPSGNTNTATKKIVKSIVINDCRYETTPNASIVVPKLIKITGLVNNTHVDGTFVINFAPNSTENDPETAFVVETSPTLGPSANWKTDSTALLSQLTNGNASNPATYQAVTRPATGVTSQYWRIKKP
jgi:hypothetical protein